MREQDGATVDGVVSIRTVNIHRCAGCVLACCGGGWGCIDQVGVAVPTVPT